MPLKRFAARRRAAAALALAGAAIAVVTIVPTAATAATRACSSASLVVWLDTQGSGAAGSSFYDLQFTNLSARACRLSGYPGVSAVNLRGRQVGHAASRDPQQPARTVTLAAGASAHTVLRIVDAGNFPRSRCGPVTAAGLRVYPPGQTASKLIPYPFAACARDSATVLTVEALQKGLGVNQ
ncbi:MAG TPA: DUF4232 domain-containing protein [Solirubrobacteraceae bacterium]|jgi:hypothetical protein|nr:DUF4232 domain-containing protein [Solirubrobacteraceae bacterium]